VAVLVLAAFGLATGCRGEAPERRADDVAASEVEGALDLPAPSSANAPVATLGPLASPSISEVSPSVAPAPAPVPTVTPFPQTFNPTPVPAPGNTVSQTPISKSDPTPSPLPDLVISVEVQLKPNPHIEWGDGCILSGSAGLPFHVGEIIARIGNAGGGDAGSFTVRLNDAVTEMVDGLDSGASATVVVSTSLRSENVAVVDASSTIDESDESNNTAKTFILVPTLVPIAPTCTPDAH